jgi:hypothetical protein
MLIGDYHDVIIIKCYFISIHSGYCIIVRSCHDCCYISLHKDQVRCHVILLLFIGQNLNTDNNILHSLISLYNNVMSSNQFKSMDDVIKNGISVMNNYTGYDIFSGTDLINNLS